MFQGFQIFNDSVFCVFLLILTEYGICYEVDSDNCVAAPSSNWPTHVEVLPLRNNY